MKVCVVGKYPPIEGGVSMDTYWTARRLAERGHQVWVVTNSDEVESDYRMYLSPEDEPWMQPTFPASGGFVSVRQLEPYTHRRMSHIPRTSATVSRLAGATLDVIRRQACDVCFAFYLEPYGVACHLAHQSTRVPYAVRHAGSDVDRLMLVPDLAEIYREVFRSAAAIVTRPDLTARFLQMGVDPRRLALGLGFDIPEVFTPDHPPLDVGRVLGAADRRAFQHIPARMLRSDGPAPDTPVIGIYGKIGETKGTFDLIRALQRVKASGLRFSLLCMSNGGQFPRLVQAIEDAGLTQETWLLPFLPHWRVPAFIRACTAVCFLERGFPIAIHGPSVPGEVMSCGTCLVLSGEIEEKQRGWCGFHPDDTAVIVKDPRDHDMLASALGRVIADPAWAADIGRRGAIEVQQRLRPERAAAAYERLFAAIAGGHDAASAVTVTAPHETANGHAPAADQLSPVQALLPRSARILETSGSRLWEEFEDQQHGVNGGNGVNGGPVAAALSFTAFALDQPSRLTAEGGEASSYLSDVLAFEAAILRACAVPASSNGEPARHDPAAQISFRGPEHQQVRPESTGRWIIHEARVDLLELDRVFRAGGPLPAALRAASVRILIIPRTNFSVKLFRVSDMTDALLRLCDGQRTVGEIVGAIQAETGAPVREQVDDAVRDALSRLQQAGVLGVRS